MQLVIDILLVVIFGLLVFRGWWRGFMKSVLSLGRLILSLVITIVFGASFAAWIDAKFVNPPVFEAVFKKLSDVAAEVTASAEGGIDALVEKIPEAFRGYLDLETVDPTAEINALVEQWSHTVADGISKIVATVIGYILLFVLAFLVLTVVIFIVTRFAKLPAIKTVDKLLGLVVGLFSGAVAVIFISVILSAILGVIGQEAVVEGSFMLRLFSGIKDLLFA
ncbi:MAG: CvpA family protein [Clostridia bacterium]|nr:CvpA family protein [Clostridia bacterium]